MLKQSQWFEMDDLKRLTLAEAAWVPLCRRESVRNDVQYDHLGFEEEIIIAVAVAFPVNNRLEALKQDFTDISPRWGNRPWVEEGEFHRAGTFKSYESDLDGEYLVIQVLFDGLEKPVWHLHHDLIAGLRLLRKKDVWVCPEEDYIEVAKLDRKSDGSPSNLRIRPQYLRDYLCARSSGLLVATYQSRAQIVEHEPDFGWTEDYDRDEESSFRWVGYIREIHEGGTPFGRKIAVIHSARTSVDPGDDVPILPHITEDTFETSTSESYYPGRKLFRVTGEIWRNHWIPPGEVSPLLREDPVESGIEFIVGSSGEKKAGSALEEHRGWLWFKPAIVHEMLSRTSGVLQWDTADTGSLGSSSIYSVHFGINELGLLNVMAKDIALLPELHKRLWIAHNILPDGGISKELHMSQNLAKPANTTAPEDNLHSALEHLRGVSAHFLESPMLTQHTVEAAILKNANRFLGVSLSGLCELAKELNKLTVEQLDLKLLKKLAPSKDKKLGSIKRLEHYVLSLGGDGHKITAPLVGINELRQGDPIYHPRISRNPCNSSALPTTEISSRWPKR